METIIFYDNAYLAPLDGATTCSKQVDDEMNEEICASATAVKQLQELKASFTSMLTDLLHLFTLCECDLSTAPFFLARLVDT